MNLLGSIQTIIIVVLFLLLCISGGFNIYYKNKLQGDGPLAGPGPGKIIFEFIISYPKNLS